MVITRTKSTVYGFTILEMVVVIAIMAILASLLLPILVIVRKKGKQTTTYAIISNLTHALENYRTNFGSYPIRYNPSNLHSGNTFDPGNSVGVDPGFFQTPCVAKGSMNTIALPAVIPSQTDSDYANWKPGENGPLMQVLLNSQCMDYDKVNLVNGRLLDSFRSPLIIRFLIIPSTATEKVYNQLSSAWTTIPAKLTTKVYMWSYGNDLTNNVNATDNAGAAYPNYKNQGMPVSWIQGQACYDLTESNNLENNAQTGTGDDILSWVQKN